MRMSPGELAAITAALLVILTCACSEEVPQASSPQSAPEASAQPLVPTPRLDRIDYQHPHQYTALPASLGKSETIKRVVSEIDGETSRERLAGIGAWVDAHLRYDATTFDRWRDVDGLLADGTFGGCADHATLVGAVARGCGIPTVWVKSLDLDWIAWFRANPDEPRSWNGHVFLEVYVDGQWRLYDASQQKIYDDYDPRQRILPGHRLAYDKGADPYDIVLSTRWELWKQQTRQFVATLDPSFVPVGDGASLRREPEGGLFIAANNPEWTWISERCATLGARLGRSGNVNWDEWLPQARRGILVVPVVGGRTPLPERNWTLLPVAPPDCRARLADDAAVVLRETAEDGTDVVQMIARDAPSLRAAVARLTFDTTGFVVSASDVQGVSSSGRQRVYAVARTRAFRALSDRCREVGLSVGGGDAAFERWLPKARGGRLVVVWIADDTPLPVEYRSLLPADADQLRTLLDGEPSGVVQGTAEDGTRVTVVAGRDEAALLGEIARLEPGALN